MKIIADCLTVLQSKTRMASLKHFSTGLVSCNVAAQPQPCGFFVQKILVPHIMADWAEHPQGWPVATPVDQLCLVCHQMIGLIGGGFITLPE